VALLAKLKYAIPLSLSAAITSVLIVHTVPGPWKTLCTYGFHDTRTGPHQIARMGWSVCVPTYWFHIAAFLGVLVASLIIMRNMSSGRVLKLMLFVFITDVVSMWIGAAVVLITFKYANTDEFIASSQSQLSWWIQFPLATLLGGVLFGNLMTRGFGVLVALPPLAWLVWERAHTNAHTVTVTR
jgi:hypothetical protein